QVILLYTFLISSIVYSQIDSLYLDLIPNTQDSIQFSIWEVHNKEMSLPDQEEKEYEKELARETLSKKDQQLCITNLQNPKSYDKSRALPYHHNLVLSIYKEGIILTEIRISTMTGNIDIDSNLTENYFRSNCSEQMRKVLIILLKKYNFIELFDEVELEGIAMN
ncbi:hypothetical protein, partial [Maribacter sp.]|uniref:hypothetical protein n=1 Tax=Maribacter sp. TaxID=1897614 RepID=UPI003296FF9D